MPPRGAAPSAGPGRAGEVARGLAAVAGLALAVVGIPALLWLVVGWPLPHALPSLAEARGALTSTRIPEEFFPKALAVLAWLAWGQFVAALAAEATAALRGTMPARVVGAGWAVQPAAARLVAAALLLLPTSGLARPVGLATPPHPAVAAHAVPAAPAAQPDAGAAAPASHGDRVQPPRPATHPARYVVRRRDTLWGIAGRHLGDPRRWPELFELNQGRPLPDPPGGRFSDPDRIYPGQALLLPADATNLPPAPPSPTPPADGTPAPGRQPAPPQAPASRPPAPATTPTPTAVPASTAPASPPATSTVSERPGPATTPAAVAAVVAVGALLAAGVVAVLDRRRRRQQRHRQPGRRIRLPTSGATARTEQHLRAAAEPQAATFLDAALRAMAAGLRHASLPAPAVDAVQLGPAELTVLLATPSPAAPPPFTPADDGRRWTLPRQTPISDLNELAGDAAAPLPGLVTLGMDAAGQLLLNLEAAGLTAMAGPTDAVRPLLDAMAVELATAASPGLAEVLLVGFGPELDQLERVRRVPRLDDALPGLERDAREAAELLDQLGCGSALAGRLASAAGSLAPTVVLLGQPPPPAALDRLAALTRQPRRATVVAVVAGDAPQARWRLEVDDDLVRAPALGLAVHPQRLTAQEYQAIGELLRTASDVDGVEPGAAPYDQLQPLPTAGDPAAEQAAAVAEPAAVEVSVLGRVELRGVQRIERSKAVELVAYLALHPQGVDADRLWEALWPGKPLNRGTLHTTVTAARTGLGRAPDGARYLPDVRDGRYRLAEAVGLDWARFQALARAGHDPDATGALRQALELVRGTPLEPPTARGYEWAVVHRTEMETAVAEAAERLGQRCLDAGDPEQANWAARRGLAASPYDERLYRLLMRAADAAGNPAGVQAVWQELLAVLGADLDYVDQDLHPDTVALYATLRGPARTRPARPRGRRPSARPT